MGWPFICDDYYLENVLKSYFTSMSTAKDIKFPYKNGTG